MSGEILGVIGPTESRGKGRFLRKYALVFSSDGVVAAKIGGILGSTMAFYFGIVGLTLYNRRLSKKGDELKDVLIDEVLNANKDNFMIPYQDVTKVEMKKGGIFSPARIIFFTREKKYTFNLLKRKMFNDYVELVKSILSDKVVV